MEALLNWVIKNKEWLFSGAGLVVITWIGRHIFKKTHASTTQTIHSGDRSINVQAGQDVSIGMKPKGSDVEDK